MDEEGLVRFRVATTLRCVADFLLVWNHRTCVGTFNCRSVRRCESRIEARF